MELVPAGKDSEVWALYNRYQKSTFGSDAVSEEEFLGFLGASNMRQSSEEGTFWWKWFVDDRLIAVSVLDVLPETIVASREGLGA